MTTMKLTHNGSCFVAISSYDERDAPKQAGFYWHPAPGECYNAKKRKPCPACDSDLHKSWWTDDITKATRLAEYADESAKAAFSEYEKAVESSRASDADIEIPAPEGLSYLPFQKAGIAYAMQRKSSLIGDDMGLGKTIQALGMVNADPEVRTILVLCPASLRLNWLREAEKWLMIPRSSYIVDSAKRVPDEAELVIANYDRLKGAVMESLLDRDWDLLIADECHALKNPKALRTKRVLGYWDKKARERVPGLISQAGRVLMLTGTPILNRPVEIQPIVGALDPQQFGNFFQFAKRYCDAHQDKYGWDFKGASNLGELQDRLRASCMVRRRKADVLTELPEKRRQIIAIPANGVGDIVEQENSVYEAQRERVEAARDEVALAHASGDAEAYRAAVDALTTAARLMFTEISIVRHEVALAKVPDVIEHIDALRESGVEKLIVFAHHKDVIARIAEHLDDECVTLTGDTSMDDRQAAVDRFQSEPSCAVFVGSIGAAGVGLTLTAADHVVFAELDWVPANVTQAEDRAHRIGQTNNVLVQHIVLDGSLDARIARTLVRKQEIIDQALDLETAIKTEPILPSKDTDGRTKRPRTYSVATEQQRNAAALCLQILAGVCDGARTLDGLGFNRIDTRIGKELAIKSLSTPLTDGQVWLARKILAKYHRQLPADAMIELKEISNDHEAD